MTFSVAGKTWLLLFIRSFLHKDILPVSMLGSLWRRDSFDFFIIHHILQWVKKESIVFCLQRCQKHSEIFGTLGFKEDRCGKHQTGSNLWFQQHHPALFSNHLVLMFSCSLAAPASWKNWIELISPAGKAKGNVLLVSPCSSAAAVAEEWRVPTPCSCRHKLQLQNWFNLSQKEDFVWNVTQGAAVCHLNSKWQFSQLDFTKRFTAVGSTFIYFYHAFASFTFINMIN